MNFNINNSHGEFTFFQLPKSIHYNEKYSKMSVEAKYLYMLMYDRNKISITNNWIDDNGDIYIYFSIENICKELNVKDQKAQKLKKELMNHELIKEVRQGLNKPNKIYVQVCDSTTDESRTSENHYSGIVKITNQEQWKSLSNNNNINNNKNNNIYSQNKSDEKLLEGEKSNKEQLDNDIEEIRKHYKGTKTKAAAIKKLPKLIKDYGKEQLIRAIERYNKYVEDERRKGFRTLKYKNESTFWNGGFVDYLDDEYGMEEQSIFDIIKTQQEGAQGEIRVSESKNANQDNLGISMEDFYSGNY